MIAPSLRVRFRSRSRSARGTSGATLPGARIPKGTPRWHRLLRTLWRSPLVRVGFAVFVAAHVRSSYLRFDEQRAAWGSSALVPTARVARSAGSVVRPADLRWIRLPLVAIPPGTASSAESVVGKRLLADVGVGEVIVQTRFTVPRLSALAARTGRHRVAVSIAQREVDPNVVIGDRVAIVDAGGATVTDNARAVQVGEKQVTVSIPTTELGALARALGGPVTVAVLGPSG